MSAGDAHSPAYGSITLNGITLTGSGRLKLTNPEAALQGSGFTDTGNTIAGEGRVSAVVDLETGGVIDATVSGQTLTVATGQTITNNGVLKAEGGNTLQVSDAVSGTGSAFVTGNSTLSFASTLNEAITFSGTNAGKVSLSQADSGTISGFGAGDTLDFANFTYAASEKVVLQSTGSGTRIPPPAAVPTRALAARTRPTASLGSATSTPMARATSSTAI